MSWVAGVETRFLLILPATNARDAETVATRMIGQVAVEFVRESPRLCVTVSAGATASTGSAGIDDIVGRANRALCEAERLGGNCVRMGMLHNA